MHPAIGAGPQIQREETAIVERDIQVVSLDRGPIVLRAQLAAPDPRAILRTERR